MWPWEHLVFGYLVYSPGVRLLRREAPEHDAVLVLVLATQLPDLIDKPLAWTFSVLPSGLSLGHSLLFAVPLAAATVALARRRDRRSLGWAFTTGYLSHLLGDAIYPYLLGRNLPPTFLLWPLVGAERAVTVTSTADKVLGLALGFVAFLGTPRGRVYLSVEAAVLCLTLALWFYDGRPGVGRLAWRSGPGND